MSDIFNQSEKARLRGDFQSASRLLKATLSQDEAHAGAWFNLGVDFNSRGDHKAALACFSRVLETHPDEPRTRVNLGWNHYLMGEHEQACQHYDTALALDPTLGLAWMNRALASRNAEKALAAALKAVELEPENPQFHLVLAFAYMRNDRWKEAFAEYEWRFQFKLPEFLEYPTPRWDGKSTGHLFIPAEQGFGDTIQFSRFVNLAAQKAERVTLAIQPELISLLEPSMRTNVEVVGLPYSADVGDCFCPLLSLPYALGLDNPELVLPTKVTTPEVNAVNLGSFREPRVGVVWAGSSEHDNDKHRSAPLEAMLGITVGQMFSFQMGEKGFAASRYWPMFRQVQLSAEFSLTAAAMKQMDVIVTVDTACAHLAGTLGIPTYLLLPYHGADSRWVEGENTPWYPSVTIYRQERAGDWAVPVGYVNSDLRGMYA